MNDSERETLACYLARYAWLRALRRAPLEDLQQEARLALWINEPKWDGRVPLRVFLEIKIRYALLDYIRLWSRHSGEWLNEDEDVGVYDHAGFDEVDRIDSVHKAKELDAAIRKEKLARLRLTVPIRRRR